jgi:hypothetical protein
MFDASTMAYEDNVTATAAVVRQCHDGGLDVEAELGEMAARTVFMQPGFARNLTRRGLSWRQPVLTRSVSPSGHLMP